MSVAAIMSPSSPGGTEYRRFDRPNSNEMALQPGATLGEGLNNTAAGRRESVDSRINQGISDMRLGGGSPYTSNHPSTTSIQNTLHSQRNPRPGLDSLSVHRISNGYQPSAERNPESKGGRTAPAITGPATGNIARAAEPTKGQAWAFPEEEIKRVGPQGPYDDSRRSSITDSIASSQFTTESRLPPGQRRLDDSGEYARMQDPDYPSVHHHSMQHKQLSDLQAEEINGVAGAQPYSRTPELRVSHKLAERKRRTEMKELFDQLRDLMPQERGSKASKWEILTKGKHSESCIAGWIPTNFCAAIAEHSRLQDHMRIIQSHYNTAAADNEMLRREIHGLRVELAQARGEMGPSGQHPPAPQQSQSQQSSRVAPYASEHYPPSSSGTELPPLRSISNGVPNGPDSMTGVQYEAPRTNGYRSEQY